jgi:putative ABC transport system ATP-binding protein
VNSHLIEVNDIGKTYPSPAGGVEALKHVSFKVNAGEFVGVVGKSGAGKSTLVNMITGVDTLTSGSIRVGEVEVHQLSEDQRNVWRGRHVGMVYQSFELLNQLTLLENITLAMDFCGNYQGKKSVERALHLLEQVEIGAHAYKNPTAISGGQQQRVAIARALANDPDIIVADEPTGNLDSQTSQTILDLFLSLQKQGKTIFMVTHNMSLIPAFSKVYQLSDGVLSEKKAKKK